MNENYASFSDLSLAMKAAFLSVTFCLRCSKVSLALVHLFLETVLAAGFLWVGSERIEE